MATKNVVFSLTKIVNVTEMLQQRLRTKRKELVAVNITLGFNIRHCLRFDIVDLKVWLAVGRLI